MTVGREVLVAELVGAVEAAPAEIRRAVAQDTLDVLAVAVGPKPLAVVGCGYDAPAFLEALADAAAGTGLFAEIGRPWTSTLEPNVAWYRDARRAVRERTAVLFVTTASRRAAIEALSGLRLDPAVEAAALGYPLCCVREFNRQQRLLHLITLRMIARQADHDEARMRRLVAAQVVLAPRSASETRRLAFAARATFAPFTSIAMCRACIADNDGPARRLSARYRELAVQTRFDRLLQ